MTSICGIQIDINYAEEIEGFDFKRAMIKGDKLQACSPFRCEEHPSFAVNLENGSWIDSGSIDENWRKGNFVQLLSFLREETYEDTEAYLLEKYRAIYKDTDSLSLNMNLSLDRPALKLYSREDLRSYSFRHPYLTNRGISEKVQKAFCVGYDISNEAVVICWFDKQGRIINMKFRSVKDKRFWYKKGGQPIKQHVFGLNFIQQYRFDYAYACESETDAMFLWSFGKPAIAFGGASMTKKQKDLVLASSIKTFIVSADNDAVGQRFGKKLIYEFSGLLDVKQIYIPDKYKDVNEIPKYELISVIEDIRGIPLSVFDKM